jgi:hypothetical protein
MTATLHTQMVFPADSYHTPESAEPKALVCKINHKRECDYCGICEHGLAGRYDD